MAPLRILHVIPAVAARYGGPSAAVVSMCQALTSRGIETLIATTDADGSRRLDVPAGEVTSWHDVPAVFFNKAWSESFKYSPDLGRWLRDHVVEFDLVHIHGVFSHACLAAAAACRRARVPYLVRPLGTLAPWSLGQKPLRKRVLLSLAAGSMLRAAAGIHYTSAEEQRSVEAALGLTHGFVVPLGVDAGVLELPMTRPADRHRNPYVLALSRIHPKKNLESLIRAFVQTRGSHEGWTLVIAGTGDAAYVDALRQLGADLGAAERVRFPGWVEGSRKHELVAGASLFVLCSKHENFGVAVLEALAAGVPVMVSTQVDLSSDVERAGAGWVTDGSDAALAATLNQALADAAARDARGVAARDLARRFTWPLVASRLCQQYDAIVADRPLRVSGLTVVPR